MEKQWSIYKQFSSVDNNYDDFNRQKNGYMDKHKYNNIDKISKTDYNVDEWSNDNMIIDMKHYRQFCIISLLWYFNFILENNKFMLQYNNIDFVRSNDYDNNNIDSRSTDFNHNHSHSSKDGILFNSNISHNNAFQQQQQPTSTTTNHVLQNFNHANTIINNLSIQELCTLQYHFYLYDVHLNGYINSTDLQSLLQDIDDVNNNNNNIDDFNYSNNNTSYSKEEIEVILQQIDPHDSNIIFFATFIQWWCY